MSVVSVAETAREAFTGISPKAPVRIPKRRPDQNNPIRVTSSSGKETAKRLAQA
jgi:hypothetical protein